MIGLSGVPERELVKCPAYVPARTQMVSPGLALLPLPSWEVREQAVSRLQAEPDPSTETYKPAAWSMTLAGSGAAFVARKRTETIIDPSLWNVHNTESTMTSDPPRKTRLRMAR
jgi:hypothetical protein